MWKEWWGVVGKSWMESSWDIATEIRSLGTCSSFPSKSWTEIKKCVGDCRSRLWLLGFPVGYLAVTQGRTCHRAQVFMCTQSSNQRQYYCLHPKRNFLLKVIRDPIIRLNKGLASSVIESREISEGITTLFHKGEKTSVVVCESSVSLQSFHSIYSFP